MKPLCFVLMPFGSKLGASGRSIDFDLVYAKVIRPAIEASGMEPIRADEEWVGGIIHKPMFERLLLCDYAVADLTLANSNVFYELGIRHAVRPHTTVLVFAEGERLPFDVASDRGIPYRISAKGRPAQPAKSIAAITASLAKAREPVVDSPIYQLLDDWPELSHSKTDVFRDRVEAAGEIKESLARARAEGSNDHKAAALRAVESEIDLDQADATVLVDLMLSYRSAEAWKDVIRLVEAMPAPIRSQTLVREQLGMALNRDEQRAEAERVLEDLIKERGASPETCGILGRVYKDQYRQALEGGRNAEAVGYRKRAIGMYLRGFEADWRDAYPGINAVQLIHELDPADPRLDELVPVVEYAVRRKIASGDVDYWDHATLLELAILDGDRQAAEEALAGARAARAEGWMLTTTADTVRAIAKRTGKRWISAIERELRPGP